MESASYDYDLPTSAIAQSPAEPRDAARLLVDVGPGTGPDHRLVTDLPDVLQPGDLLVVNDTRVRRARLALAKPTGGAAEVLLLDRADAGWWEALVRPGRRLREGTVLTGERGLHVEIGADLGGGRRLVRLPDARDADHEEEMIDAGGAVPLPPYITRRLRDPERYQTVFADRTGSAAAPTAGLHLTDEVLQRCRTAGAAVATVDLVIGIDTFRPITAASLDDHRMHRETYRVPEATVEACARADRVVAVGTTTVRALESMACTGALAGSTDLFIRPGFEFRVVDRLLTNFHQPRSSLLVLVDAFVGPRWRDLYRVALGEGYRFLSFGDAMFLQPSPASIR